MCSDGPLAPAAIRNPPVRRHPKITWFGDIQSTYRIKQSRHFPEILVLNDRALCMNITRYHLAMPGDIFQFMLRLDPLFAPSGNPDSGPRFVCLIFLADGLSVF